MADGYQPQLNPGGQSDYGGAPSDWGGGLTRGLEEAGGSIDSAIHQIKDKNRDAEATAAGVQLAQNSAQLDQQAIAARQQAGPGGDGHVQTVNSLIDTTSAGALGNIRDPHIRRVFQERYAQLKGELSTREYGWQAGQYVNHLATNVTEATNTYAADQAANPDINKLPNQLSAIQDTIGATSLDPDIKDKLTREQQAKVVLAHGNAVVRTDPRSLIGDPATGQQGLLDRPEYYQYLKDQPEQIDALRHSAEVEIRRQDADQRYNANQAKTAQQAANDVFEYRVSSLGYVPTADEWQQYISSNKQLGLVKPGLEISDLKDKADINQQYRTASPVQWHSDINTLQEKVTNGSATDYDRMHLKNLIAAAGPAVDKFNTDPQGFAANTANPAPPIDLSSSDPSSLQLQGAQRVQWARTFAATNGIADPSGLYLSNDEKKLFTDGMKQGPAGQIETLQKLQSIFGPTATGAIAQHLMPGDKNVEFMSSLNGRGMELYRRGATALDNKIVHLGATSGQDAADDLKGMSDALDFYAPAIPIDLQPAFKQVAEKIAAGVAFENGNHQPTGDQLKTIVSQAVQRIGGMQGSTASGQVTGGFANWYGTPVWLPQNMSRGEFQQRMSRAGPDDWAKAGGQHPYYVGPDGKPTPLSPVQMSQLPHYRLVPIKPATGDFALADQNGNRLKQKDGRTDWQFNIRNLR